MDDDGIASPPASFRYDGTNAAIASTVVEMKKSIPFQQAYAAATSQSEIDAIVARHSELFASNKHVDIIKLHFAASGTLSITHDGKSLTNAETACLPSLRAARDVRWRRNINRAP